MIQQKPRGSRPWAQRSSHAAQPSMTSSSRIARAAAARVVDPHDACAVVDGPDDGRERRVVARDRARVRRRRRQSRQERLPRRPDDERTCGARRELGQRREQREVVGDRLAEADPGIGGERARRDARGARRLEPLDEELGDLGDDVVVARDRAASCGARRACASRRSPHPRRRRPTRISGSSRPAETSLTTVAPAASAAGGHRGLGGVDADGHAGHRQRGARRPARRGAAPRRRTRDRRRGGSTRRRRRAGRRRRPRARARARRRRRGRGNSPPSENESGVTFTTPMTAGRAPHTARHSKPDPVGTRSERTGAPNGGRGIGAPIPGLLARALQQCI